MRTRTKAVLGVATGILGAALGGWLYAPTYIKHQVEQQVPGATVGSVSIHPWYVNLHDVRVDRSNLQATLDLVRVTSKTSAHIVGGQVRLTQTTPDANQPVKPGRIISFEGINLTTSWNDRPITVQNAHGTIGQIILADQASTSHPKFGTVVAKVVRFDPHTTSGSFRAEKVSIHGFKPLPTNPCERVELSGVEVTPGIKYVSVKTATCGGNRLDTLQVRWTDSNVLLRAGTAVVSHSWLNPVPLVFSRPIHLDWDGQIADIRLGGANIVVSPSAKHMDIVGECSAFASEMPQGLAEPLKDITFSGKLDIHILWDSADPDVTVKGMCRADCSSPALRALRRPFTYQVYGSDGSRKPRQSGPGSAQWVPLGFLGENLINATIAREDPGFLSHRGYIPQAFRNSLRINLDAGKFLRGGSTITMQLAKNLWLNRDKTFGRKAQELLLASALESCFGKDDILELYLNVIEFGPDLYGIGPGAQKWFGVTPAELSPRQAFWLASILPHPRTAVQPNEAVLARTEKLMKRMIDAGHLPESMREDIPEGALDGW